MESLLIYFDK